MAQAVEKINEIERKIKAQISIAPLQEEIANRFKQISRNARIQGFRPGKAPIKIVEQQYGADVKAEVYSKAIEMKFGEIVQENKLQIVGMPQIEHEPLSKINKDFEFTATFEVLPDIKDIDLKKIEISQPETKVTKKDVESTLEVMQKQRTQFTKVDRAAKKGDRLHVKLESFIDEKSAESTGAEPMQFILGDKNRFDVFDDQLVGLKANDLKDFEIQYPKDHDPKQLAGKTAKYHVEVTQVDEGVAPKIDAEFAKSLGVEDGDVAKMNSQIEDSLKEEVEKRIKLKVKDQIFVEIVKNAKFDLPKSIIDNESYRLMQQMIANFQRQGANPKDLNLEPSMFNERAEQTARLRIVLADLVQKNNLQATPEQVKEKVASFATMYDDSEKAIQWFYEDEKRLDEPAALATEDNVVSFVLKSCKIKNEKVSFDELLGNK
jgi:trigger factor